MTAPDDEPNVASDADVRPAENPGDAYRFHPDYMADVRKALEKGKSRKLHDLIDPLHAADLADLLELLQGEERLALARTLESEVLADVLSELDEIVKEDVISVLHPELLAEAVSQLETDDAVYVLEDLDKEAQREVLDAIAPEDRAALEEGLAYEDETAGRLMRRQMVSVPIFWTVGQTIDYLREEEDLPDEFHEIFVVDPRHHPIGTIPLARMLRSKRHMVVEEVMEVEQKLIPVDMDQEEVAYLFQQYDLLSAAVVDTEGRLVGVITIDDVVDVIHEEAAEDILRLGGVSDGDLNESLREIARTRFTWLLVNLGTAILASVIISMFEATIEQLVALAVLMPIVASMGGNAGTQTMTVAVRGLATRELSASNAFRIVNKELAISTINGILLAILIGVASAWWFESPMLGLVLAVAMIINMVVAGLAGILIPLGLDRANIDPAVASSVFVTTITDVVGFFAFLGLAAVWLI